MKNNRWKNLTAVGQVKAGDFLSFTVGGKDIVTKAKEILFPGTPQEEVLYNRKKNHYFITSLAVDGVSTHKDVMVWAQFN